MTGPIRVLIVDDSAVVRGLLVRALAGEPEIQVVRTAMHGQAALEALRREPADVVLLDVEMPVMNGLEALAHIQRDFPDIRVVMVSSMTGEGAAATIQALALGAAACIGKPVAKSTSESIERLSRELVTLLKALGRRRSRSLRPGDHAGCLSAAVRPELPPQVLVIGASTGGPQALSQVLSGLPRDFAVPTLIVQHMPPMFTSVLAKHLESDTGRPCSEARDGERISPGHTYVAPGDFHLLIERRGDEWITALNQAPQEHFCRPSANPLFQSAARCFGPRVLAVVLTGMGEDGVEGCESIARAHGHIIVQDEASSVVWGMPAAVVRHGIANEILPLPQIAGAIVEICESEVVHA